MILNRGRHPSKIPYSEMYLICLKKTMDFKLATKN